LGQDLEVELGKLKLELHRVSDGLVSRGGLKGGEIEEFAVHRKVNIQIDLEIIRAHL
jgi:hypothetical protein